MYLRANTRYPRRRRIAIWRILLWLGAPLIIFVGIGIYQNREAYIPMIEGLLSTAVGEAGNAVATVQAPTPTVTPDPQAGLTRAMNDWNQRNYQEAVNRFEEIIAALPNDLSAHYHFTLGLITEGRAQEAIEAAANTVTANPFSSDAWAIQALALTLGDRYNEAVASSLRALEIDMDNARAHAFFALALLELNRVDRANAEVNRAIELDPNGWEGYYARAQIAARSTFDFAAMRRDLEVAYDNSGGLTFIGVDLALEDINREGGDPAAGEQRLKEMDQRNPNNPLILTQLASYYRTKVGDPDQALQYLTRCVTVIPTAIDCHYLLGRIQRDSGEQPEQAAASLKQAIDLGSQRAQHYYWAALSQQELGNCAAASEYWMEGYELAKQSNSFVADFEAEMRLSGCGPFDIPTPTPTISLDGTEEFNPDLEATAAPGT